MAIRNYQVDFLQTPFFHFGEVIFPGEFILTIGDPGTKDLPESVTPDSLRLPGAPY